MALSHRLNTNHRLSDVHLEAFQQITLLTFINVHLTSITSVNTNILKLEGTTFSTSAHITENVGQHE